MGLFGKLFDKKVCDICGSEIGLLGNRKLEDGNLCKECSAKLSPFFSDRRSSTVEEIRAQLEYREKNKDAVAKFHTTSTIGDDWKLHLDEDACKFMVTRARKLTEANPDVIDFSQVTGVKVNIDEQVTEDKKKDQEGKEISYNPPRYFYSYDFNVTIHVNHPYFDEITFRLNSHDVEINPEGSVTSLRKPDPMNNVDYREYYEMAQEIKERLTNARQQVRDEAAEAASVCPWCGAPAQAGKGFCEYCGGSLKG